VKHAWWQVSTPGRRLLGPWQAAAETTAGRGKLSRVSATIEQTVGVGDAALAYCRRGWSIVPMHAPADGGCSCGRGGCAAIAKHPRVSWEARMEVAATEKEVEEWWRRWPHANIGVVTGCVSGIVVLDVDPRSDGALALGALEERWGALPGTLEARTGGSGRHLWFSFDEELSSAVLAPGLELKAERSVVIAPPSVHATGHRYVWIPGRGPDELTPARLPESLSLIAHGEAGGDPRNPLHEQPPRTAQERTAFAQAWARAGIELRSGDRYYLCLFHDDHHPSLHIDSEHCRWYCFGCRRGGGIGRLRRLLGEPPRPSPRARLRRHVGASDPVTMPGQNEVAVMGESHHQDELLTLAGGRRPYGGVEPDTVAELIAGSDQVVVLIDDTEVGALSREDAHRLAPAIREARRDHGVATCRAVVRGGWDRGGEDIGMFGVVLLVP
jgi:Bifunctional DNA primase/polymerase, N-terminal/CHC2 zinc finger